MMTSIVRCLQRFNLCVSSHQPGVRDTTSPDQYFDSHYGIPITGTCYVWLFVIPVIPMCSAMRSVVWLVSCCADPCKQRYQGWAALSLKKKCITLWDTKTACQVSTDIHILSSIRPIFWQTIQQLQGTSSAKDGCVDITVPHHYAASRDRLRKHLHKAFCMVS